MDLTPNGGEYLLWNPFSTHIPSGLDKRDKYDSDRHQNQDLWVYGKLMHSREGAAPSRKGGAGRAALEEGATMGVYRRKGLAVSMSLLIYSFTFSHHSIDATQSPFNLTSSKCSRLSSYGKPLLIYIPWTSRFYTRTYEVCVIDIEPQPRTTEDHIVELPQTSEQVRPLGPSWNSQTSLQALYSGDQSPSR